MLGLLRAEPVKSPSIRFWQQSEFGTLAIRTATGAHCAAREARPHAGSLQLPYQNHRYRRMQLGAFLRASWSMARTSRT